MKSDDLKEIKERFDAARDAMSENFTRMKEDLRFSDPTDPQQWPELDRRRRGIRPSLTFDQTNQYVLQVVNDSRQNKPAIKVRPEEDGDIRVAQALNGMIRHIEDRSRAHIAYDTALEYAARIGLGWIRVVTTVLDPARNLQEIRIKRVIDPFSVFLDPDWSEPDGSDAMWGFAETRMSRADFTRQYGKRSTIPLGEGDWADDKTVRIAEYFCVEEESANRILLRSGNERQDVGEDEYWKLAERIGMRPDVIGTYKQKRRTVKWQKVTAGDILESTTFPATHIPLIPVIGNETWIDGKRKLGGMVRRMRDAQLAYNHERSSYVETVAMQPKVPWLVSAEAVEGHEDGWANASTSQDAYLLWNSIDAEGRPIQKPTREAPPAMASAFMQGAQLAIADIQAAVGMYKSNLGANSNAKSGRAIGKLQQEGDTATFHYIDNLSRSINQAGRILVEAIPTVYDTERVARVLGEDGESQQIMIDPNLPQASAQRKDGTIVINPTVGHYDVTVSVGPAYTTRRAEAADAISQLTQGNPQLFALVGDVLVKMMDWPEADKISARLKATLPPQVKALENGQNPEMQAAQQQMQQMGQQMQQMEALIQDLQQALTSKAAEESLRSDIEMLKVNIDDYRADTERLKVAGAAMTPEQIQMIIMQTVQQIMTQPVPTNMNMNGAMPPEPPLQ